MKPAPARFTVSSLATLLAMFLALLPGLPGRAAFAAGAADAAEVQIEDFAWIAGTWGGPAFGAECEEVWRPPMGGTMLGMFKLVRDGAPSFYELMLITREEGRFVLKVKHFSPEFHAWEDKEEAIVFPLLRVEPGKIVFDGLTMARNGDNGLDITLRMRHGDQVRDELLRLERRAP